MIDTKHKIIGNYWVEIRYSPDSQHYHIQIAIVDYTNSVDLSKTSFTVELRDFHPFSFETYEEAEYCFDMLCGLLKQWEIRKKEIRNENYNKIYNS